jgi:integrase
MGSTVATECLSEPMITLKDFSYQLVTISWRLVAEVLGLGHDVNFTNHRITIRRLKNGLGGEKPLWRHTAKLIRSYLRERRDVGPYLFTGRKGPLQKRQVQQLFTEYAEAAGIKERSIHALRHSMAVHLLEAGRGIEYVADHLGHKNIQNTRIYAQITNPLREQVFRELEQHPKIVRLS